MPNSIYSPLILSLLGILLFRNRLSLCGWISDDNVLTLMLIGRCIEIVLRAGREELRLEVRALVEFRVEWLIERIVGPWTERGEELIRRIVGKVI